MGGSAGGVLLDNMRHVQEHAAQLNLILGQRAGWPEQTDALLAALAVVWRALRRAW